MNIDNQLLGSTCFNGLHRFKRDDAAAVWRHWSTWPGMGIPIDCASDNVSGVFALMYYFRLNAWVWPDPAHATARAFDMTLKDLGLWDFALLVLIGFNLPHGSDKDESRFNQMRECVRTAPGVGGADCLGVGDVE